MKKIWVILTIATLAALSPAPIIDRAAAGKDLPVHSQQQYAQEQSLNGRQGVVGAVPTKTDESGFNVESTRNDGDAKDNVAAAQNVSAVNDLKQEEVELKGETKSGIGNWLMPIFFVAVGFLSVFGFRMWIDKQVPMPRERRKAQW